MELSAKGDSAVKFTVTIVSYYLFNMPGKENGLEI